MYAQIAIGCQTLSEVVVCEGCIAYKVCQLKQELSDKLIQTQQAGKEVLHFLSADDPLIIT